MVYSAAEGVFMEKGEMGYRALKELGSKAIQDALTKAMCELTDEDYRVDVNSIDFDANTGSWMHDETKITINVRRERAFTDLMRDAIEQETASPA
jgi:hypothetical protein